MSFSNCVEIVSRAHADRLSDQIAAIIIDAVNHKDRFSGHAAVEVFISGNNITIGGEITTTLEVTDQFLRDVVTEAFETCGYRKSIRDYWSIDECLLADDMNIINQLCSQSPDIALGTTSREQDTGWNDQTLAFSSSDDSTPNHVGCSFRVATEISDFLWGLSQSSFEQDNSIKLGPDNKVLVTLNCNDSLGMYPDSIKSITIAVPHTQDQDTKIFAEYIKESVSKHLQSVDPVLWSNSHEIEWIINGTGKFVVHGPRSDSGVTGRKISVNCPSAGPIWANKNIGGGSMIKPAHASDLLLPIYARFITNVIVHSGLAHYCVLGLSSSIGLTKLGSFFIWADLRPEIAKGGFVDEFFRTREVTPRSLIELFKLFDPEFSFSDCVANNFYGNASHSQTWEDPELIDKWSRELIAFVKLKVLGL